MKRLKVLWTIFLTTLGLVSLTGLTYANNINNGRTPGAPEQVIVEPNPALASPTPVAAAPTATPSAIFAPATPTRPATAAPSSTATPMATSSPAAMGTLVFSEEFNGSTLDTTRWYHCFWWASTYCTSQPNNEQELYNASNILVGNGLLDLRATKQTTPTRYCDRNCQNYDYLSGLIQSGGTDTGVPSGFTFQYGYVEASVKIPSGPGLWPAFWLWPANYKDPPEIDIMENLGNDPTTMYMTYHSPTTGRHQCAYTGADFSKDFHRFGVDWEAGQITWYIDGIARCNYSGPDVAAQPMYPILNLAVGGNWPGAPDASTVLPADYMVDYVRLYRR